GVVAVVDQDGKPGARQLTLQFFERLRNGLLLEVERDDVNVVRGYFHRPDDAVVVVVRFDAGGHHAVEPDTVAAHDGGAALALLVEVIDPDALGVDGAELEDVGHLHAALHFKRATAASAGIATASEGNLGDDVGAPVALVVHVADVPVG